MSVEPGPDRHEVSRGIRAGVVAYTVWGLLTIYWKRLSEFRPFELIGWRVLGAGVLMVVVISAAGRWPTVTAAVRDRRILARITVAALLLTANWTAYVYAVVHDQVIETALGYFMAPLGTMALGIVVLKERPTAAQRTAMVLAAIAVIVLSVSYGRPPYSALTIAVTWSLYGLLKRQVPLGAVESLATETFVLIVPAAIVVAAMAGQHDSIPRMADARDVALVSLAGVATVVPLTMFAFAATRVPFTVLGPLNYLVPTINLLLGWWLYDEGLPPSRIVGFAMVWGALVVITVDRVRASVNRRRGISALAAATPD